MISMARSLPILGRTWSEFVGALIPSAIAGCLTYLAVTLARETLAMQGVTLLVALICVGIVSYFVSGWLVNRRGCLEALALARGVLSVRAGPTSS